LGEYVEARRFLGDVVTSARQQSAVAGLAFPLACLSELEYRTGRWTIAYALADDSVRMATEVGARSQLSFSLVCLARVEAGLGKQDDCRAHLRDALAISRELSVGSIEVYARSVAGGARTLSRRWPGGATPRRRRPPWTASNDKLGRPKVAGGSARWHGAVACWPVPTVLKSASPTPWNGSRTTSPPSSGRARCCAWASVGAAAGAWARARRARLGPRRLRATGGAALDPPHPARAARHRRPPRAAARTACPAPYPSGAPSGHHRRHRSHQP
jgi:hypothetical protein